MNVHSDVIYAYISKIIYGKLLERITPPPAPIGASRSMGHA